MENTPRFRWSSQLLWWQQNARRIRIPIFVPGLPEEEQYITVLENIDQRNEPRQENDTFVVSH